LFPIKKLLLSSQTTGAKPKRLNLSLMTYPNYYDAISFHHD